MNPATNATATNATLVIASAAPSGHCDLHGRGFQSGRKPGQQPCDIDGEFDHGGDGAGPDQRAHPSVCYDTPLYVTFDRPPTINNVGNITIYDASNLAMPLTRINMALGSPQSRTHRRRRASAAYPVIVTGNTAAIYPHSGVMTFNKTYYVTIDDGVFTDNVGAYFAGITEPRHLDLQHQAHRPGEPDRTSWWRLTARWRFRDRAGRGGFCAERQLEPRADQHPQRDRTRKSCG